MYIFELANKFDPDTGKPIQVKKFKELRCDFTGELMGYSAAGVDYENEYASYNLDYADHDPCFGACGEEFEFGQKYNVYMFTFLSNTYHFINDYGHQERYGDLEMMQKYLKEEDGPKTFADMCRASRIATATRLIEEKVITPNQLYEDE